MFMGFRCAVQARSVTLGYDMYEGLIMDSLLGAKCYHRIQKAMVYDTPIRFQKRMGFMLPLRPGYCTFEPELGHWRKTHCALFLGLCTSRSESLATISDIRSSVS